MPYACLSLTKYSAKNCSTLLHWLLTNPKTEKHAHVLFKAVEKPHVLQAYSFHPFGMARDPHHARELCLHLKFREPEVVLRYEFTWRLSLEPGGLCVRAPQDVPRLSLRGTAGEGEPQHMPWRCMVLPSERHVLRGPPAPCPLWACERWQGWGRGEVWEGKGKEEGPVFPVLCLISSSLLASVLTPARFHYLTLLPYEK